MVSVTVSVHLGVCGQSTQVTQVVIQCVSLVLSVDTSSCHFCQPGFVLNLHSHDSNDTNI